MAGNETSDAPTPRPMARQRRGGAIGRATAVGWRRRDDVCVTDLTGQIWRRSGCGGIRGRQLLTVRVRRDESRLVEATVAEVFGDPTAWTCW
jgi:hypothetical protein